MKALLLLILVCGSSAWTGTVIHLNAFHAELESYPALQAQLAKEDASALIFGSGDSIGSGSETSLLLGERSGQVSLQNLGMHADTLGNNNFDVGREQLDTLLGASRVKTVALNVRAGLGNLSGVQFFGGGEVAYVGVLSDEDVSSINPRVISELVVDSAAVAAREARLRAHLQGATFLVAALNMRLDDDVTPGQFAAENFPGFDLVLAGSFISVDERVSPTAPYVASGPERGAGYARIHVVNSQVVSVDQVALGDELDASSQLELGLWEELATVLRQEVVGVTERGYLARSEGIDGERAVYTGENVVATFVARSYAHTLGAQLGIINSGGVRSDFPRDSFNETASNLDVQAGDCLTLSPFGSFLLTINVTGADLYEIAHWAINSQPGRVNAHFYGIRWTVRFLEDGTGLVDHLALDATGETPVNTTIYSLALSEFLAFGGDGFPVSSGRAEDLTTIRDNQAICTLLRDEGAALGLLSGKLLVERPANGLVATVGTMSVRGLNGTVSSVSLGVSPTREQLSSIGSFFGNNPYALVFRSSKLVGQLAGGAIRARGVVPSGSMELCVPFDTGIAVEEQFTEAAMGIHEDGSESWLALDVPVTRNAHGVCGTFTEAPRREVAAVLLAANLSTFSIVETVFLTIFGVLYLILFFVALFVFVRSIREQRATRGNLSWKDHVNAINIIRLSVLLMCIFRALFFIMLPQGPLDNSVGATFLFEIVIALSLIVCSCITFLFFSIFQYQEKRFKSLLATTIPLILINLLTLAAFVAVIAVWGASTDTGQRRTIALVYRIIVACFSIILLAVMLFYGLRLSCMLVLQFKQSSRPSWTTQLKRFGALAISWGIGILATVILMIYQLARPFDPVTESTAFLLVFLLIFEIGPIIVLIVTLALATARYVKVEEGGTTKKHRLTVKELTQRSTMGSGVSGAASADTNSAADTTGDTV